MNCFYHPDRPGNGQCPQCHKVLCVDCMQLINTGVCADCAVKNNRAYQLDVMITLGLSVVCFLFGLIGGKSFSLAYAFFAIFWGRRFAKDIMSGFLDGLFVSIHVYIFIVIAKFLIYLMVGFVTAPIAVVYSVYRLIQNKRYTDQILEYHAKQIA